MAPSLEARVRSEGQTAALRGSKADLRTNGNAMHPVDCRTWRVGPFFRRIVPCKNMMPQKGRIQKKNTDFMTLIFLFDFKEGSQLVVVLNQNL